MGLTTYKLYQGLQLLVGYIHKLSTLVQTKQGGSWTIWELSRLR